MNRVCTTKTTDIEQEEGDRGNKKREPGQKYGKIDVAAAAVWETRQ